MAKCIGATIDDQCTQTQLRAGEILYVTWSVVFRRRTTFGANIIPLTSKEIGGDTGHDQPAGARRRISDRNERHLGLKSRGAFLRRADSPIWALDILALTPLALLLSTARIRRAARARPKLAGKNRCTDESGPRRSKERNGRGRSRKHAQTTSCDRILSFGPRPRGSGGRWRGSKPLVRRDKSKKPTALLNGEHGQPFTSGFLAKTAEAGLYHRRFCPRFSVTRPLPRYPVIITSTPRKRCPFVGCPRRIFFFIP